MREKKIKMQTKLGVGTINPTTWVNKKNYKNKNMVYAHVRVQVLFWAQKQGFTSYSEIFLREDVHLKLLTSFVAINVQLKISNFCLRKNGTGEGRSFAAAEGQESLTPGISSEVTFPIFVFRDWKSSDFLAFL